MFNEVLTLKLTHSNSSAAAGVVGAAADRCWKEGPLPPTQWARPWVETTGLDQVLDLPWAVEHGRQQRRLG